MSEKQTLLSMLASPAALPLRRIWLDVVRILSLEKALKMQVD